MATGMKQWLGLIVGGTAFVAVWNLPPEAMDARPVRLVAHEEARFRALNGELRLAYATLQRLRWQDSLSALVLESVGEGPTVAFPSGVAFTDNQPGHVREERLGRLREQIRGELATLDRGGDVAFALVYQPITHALPPAAAMDDRGRVETYVGTRDGANYCIRVRVNGGRQLTAALDYDVRWYDDSPDYSALGGCRFYVTYGLAGPAVQEWLASGALDFALTSARGGRGTAIGRRSFFGFAPRRGEADLTLNRCFAGIVESCAGLFLYPDANDTRLREKTLETLLPGATSINEGTSRFSGHGSRLFADLESEFGSEAFRGFWTSQADVEAAFEAAFGVDAGSWLVSWVEAHQGIELPGPGLPRSAAVGTFLAIGLLAGLAYGRARKQSAA